MKQEMTIEHYRKLIEMRLKIRLKQDKIFIEGFKEIISNGYTFNYSIESIVISLTKLLNNIT